ncbi:diguanylate cyclase [Rhizobium sp. CFBP 8762]|uniref:GGDEF domain-containing response regulator n=1 Tax=Rhizobium sp. CFBP 8762 TaxID=2775279 RepID=UPI00177D15F0|nr:diguanylate cyclase [Rhizobium sp. CFBP 8762]MBD8554750.1 diguanylate cyclase [Rhizobium sp. CFBP 8762]
MKFRGRPRTGYAPRHAGTKILLVEDSSTFTAAASQALGEALGADIQHCSSLAQVQDLIETKGRAFALAVVDLNGPDAPDGEVLAYLQKRGVATVVFTAAFNDETEEQMLARRVAGYVSKCGAEALDELCARVDQVLTMMDARVLILSRDGQMLDMLDDLLAANGCQVVVAEDGADALTLLDEGLEIDVAVVDIGAAGESAFWLLQQIHARCGEDSVRLFGLSTQAHKTVGPRFMRSGGDDFMSVPFITDEFLSRVGALVRLQKRMTALKDLASMDYLTSLPNRRHFFENGPRMIEHAVRRGQNSCIAIADIDHFKRLNDTYGHEVGDIVLRDVAVCLKACIGKPHLLARLGGEEFGILFSNCDIGEATGICEAVRKRIASAAIEADGETISLTISIGLAAIQGGETFDNYLNAADQFLYMAKHAGRDQVMSEYQLIRAIASSA